MNVLLEILILLSTHGVLPEEVEADKTFSNFASFEKCLFEALMTAYGRYLRRIDETLFVR